VVATFMIAGRFLCGYDLLSGGVKGTSRTELPRIN
jgi:hypothetical protein